MEARRQSLSSLAGQSCLVMSSESVRGAKRGPVHTPTIVLKKWTTQFIAPVWEKGNLMKAGLRVAGAVKRATQPVNSRQPLPAIGKAHRSSRITKVFGHSKCVISQSGTTFLLEGPPDTQSWDINRDTFKLLEQQGNDEECRIAKMQYNDLMRNLLMSAGAIQGSECPLESHSVWRNIITSFVNWSDVAERQSRSESGAADTVRSTKFIRCQQMPTNMVSNGSLVEGKAITDSTIQRNTAVTGKIECKQSDSRLKPISKNRSKPCPHGRRKHRCRDCKGCSICSHGKNEEKCPKCKKDVGHRRMQKRLQKDINEKGCID